MSERVQLLLSDRILGMTLVPEGRIWNYGIGLTQLWSPNISYAVTLDTPLLFWAEEHRPAAFISVRSPCGLSRYPLANKDLSSPIWRRVMIAPTSKITSRRYISDLARRSSYSQMLCYIVIVMYCNNKLLYFHDH